MLKKALLLLVFVLLLAYTMVSGQQQYDENNDPDELLDKAKYSYGVLEDYPRALQYLERIIEIAGQPHIRADALMRKSYVFFLMKKDVADYDAMVRQALKYDARISVDGSNYKRKFVEIVSMIRQQPETSAKLIQSEVFKVNPLSQGPCGKLFLSVNMYYQQLRDKHYKEVYSGSAALPQIKAGVQLIRNFYLIAGYGFFTADGTIKEWSAPAKSTQNIFMAGFRINKRFTPRLAWKIDAMAVVFKYKEEALETLISKSTTGYGLEGGFSYELAKYLFTEISIGYLYGSDIHIDREVDLGGLRMGFSLGLKL